MKINGIDNRIAIRGGNNQKPSPQSTGKPAAHGRGDQVNLNGQAKLMASMRALPEVSDATVLRAIQLLETDGYPPDDVLDSLSEKLADGFLNSTPGAVGDDD